MVSWKAKNEPMTGSLAVSRVASSDVRDGRLGTVHAVGNVNFQLLTIQTNAATCPMCPTTSTSIFSTLS